MLLTFKLRNHSEEKKSDLKKSIDLRSSVNNKTYPIKVKDEKGTFKVRNSRKVSLNEQ